MNAAANTERYSEPAPFVVKGSKGLSVKPKVRPIGDGSFLVTLVCGATGTITKVTNDRGADVYLVDGEYRFGRREEYDSLELAIRVVTKRSRLELAPVCAPVPDADCYWHSLATSCDRDVEACVKLLRKLLRERTGREWSVTQKRGTSCGWLQIDAPPRRLVGPFRYLSFEDQILLSAALGHRVHEQGESIRTERGVRGAYVFSAAGVGVPEDWHVADRGWD